MKRIITVTAILVIGFQVASGQSLVQRAESFSHDVLPAFSTYFSSAELTQNDQLQLPARENYTRMSRDGRKAVMDNLVKSWQESLVVVKYETSKELWGWNSDTREAILVDSWDSDPKPAAAVSPEPLSNTEKHPWFFYIGSAQRMDSEKNINGALSARVGFFLLKDTWDLAATFSEQLSGNFESEDISLQTSIGIMSKLYYPIRKYNISPFIGGEAALSLVKDSDPSFSPSFLLGVSWFVGSGSLDVGIRAGNGSSMMVGYTLIPKFRK